MGNLQKVVITGLFVLGIYGPMASWAVLQEMKANQVIEPTGLSGQSQDEGALDQVGLCELQERLSATGFYQGKVDGVMGASTTKAIAEYELKHSMKNTGLPSEQLLSRIRSTTKDHNALTKNSSSLKGPATVPSTGTVFQNHLSSGRAPLQVVTADQDIHFFVKVQSVSDTESYKTLFLRSGGTLNERLPLGSYLINMRLASIGTGRNVYLG